MNMKCLSCICKILCQVFGEEKNIFQLTLSNNRIEEAAVYDFHICFYSFYHHHILMSPISGVVCKVIQFEDNIKKIIVKEWHTF